MKNNKTNFISLRQILSTDIKDLIEISFYDAIQAKTLQEATEMQAKTNKDYIDGNSIHWGIIDKLTRLCSITSILRSRLHDCGDVTGCVDFGLKDLKLKRVWASTSPQNHRAIKLFERLNFKRVEDSKSDEIEYGIISCLQ